MAVAVGAAALSAGCSAVQSAVEKVHPDHDLTTTQGATMRIEADPVGEPVVTGHYVTSYVRTGNILQIATWDMTTGDELWRDDAAVGGETSGVELAAHVVKIAGHSYVPFLENAPDLVNDWLRLGVVDLVTGRDVQTTPVGAEVWAGSRPDSCDDDKGVCFLGRTETGSKVSAWQEWEYDLGTYSLRAAAAAAPAGVDRMLGTHMFDNGVRPPKGAEMLGYLSDSKVVWQRPIEDVFAAGYSSDWGWDWHDPDGADVVVGTGQHSSPTAADGQTLTSLDLTASKAVGLDAASGATKWTIDGARPCFDRDDIGLDDKHVVLCVFTSGSVTWSDGDPAPKDIAAKLEVVEIATGKPVHSYPLTAADAVPLDSQSVGFAAGSRSAVLSQGGKTTVIDLAAGEATTAPKDAVLLCKVDRAALQNHLSGSDQGATSAFNTGHATVPCSTAKKTDPSTSRASLWAITHAGVKGDDGYYAVNAQKSIDIYRLAAAKK